MLVAVYFGPFGGITNVKFPKLTDLSSEVIASSDSGP